MSLSRRLALVFKTKANKILDRAEDPREVLDYSYQRQLDLLQQVRRGVADVATSRKRVELQVRQLQASADRLGEQAGQAVAANRDDLAREALGRRAAVSGQAQDLLRQHASLRAEEDKLTVAAQRLQAKVEAFRTRKETVKATYTAAEAQTRIGEAVSGISEEMGDVGLAIQRAEDRTQQMQARAGAIDELLASGALDDATVTGRPRDDIQAELDRITTGSDVERELAALKGAPPAAGTQLPAAGSGIQLPAADAQRAIGSEESRAAAEPGERTTTEPGEQP
ncbi:phage shock protein PspA [Candidatus Protofrankia californiensis]|uniref:Phage shock protein PspA n=1 Tax=Candidatus Protofrankia californiensis TaxID=1839754 RepID=A0A1C3P1E2_9ACTN|nr:phage shock protein PspA [Candidatus Protofrankia californiensis]